MASPFHSRKKPVDMAAPVLRVSRIRRDPPPVERKELVVDVEGREQWTVIIGVVTFAIAIFVLILAFGAVIRWGMKVSKGAPTRFGQLTAAGLSGTIFFYASINLLMVMGLAPVVGVPGATVRGTPDTSRRPIGEPSGGGGTNSTARHSVQACVVGM